MGLVFSKTEKGELRIAYVGPWKGLNTEAPPNQIPEAHLPALQNVDLPAGIPVRIDGFVIHDTSMNWGGVPTLLARYNPSTGTGVYLGANEAGEVFYWDDVANARVIVRRGLSTTAGIWWSHTQLADYLIIANPTDGNYKWDGTRLLPLGAKYIADMESDESTWTGGTVETTTVREGTQARSLSAVAGGTATMDLASAAARNFTSGLLEAKAFNATTDRISFYVNLDTAANLDTALSYIRFRSVTGSDVNYFQTTASSWGTLVNGWNLVRVAKSTFTTVGAPNWNSIQQIVFFIDANPATSVTAIFDDLYTIYEATAVMPAVQIISTWKNMVLGARSDAEKSEFYYTKVAAPDEYSDSAHFPIQEADGDEITGLHPFYNQVLLTKDNTCHSVSGTVAGTVYPNYNLEVILVSTEHGGSSHRALVEAGGQIYIWWRNEIHRYRGTGTEKISKHIDPTLATVNMSRLRYIVGARRRPLNQIFWYYSDGAATQNSSGIRWDFAEGAFITTQGQTMALAEQVFESGTEYLLTAEYDGDIMRQDSGADYAGASITASVTYPWTSGQLPDEVKSWLDLHVPYQTNTGNLIVEYRVASHYREFDAATYVTAGTIDQAVAGELGRIFIGERSRWIQLRLRSEGARFTSYSPIFLYAALQDGVSF